MKKKYLLVVFFAVFMVGGLFAQPSGGGDTGGPVDAAPIDGGIIALVVAGVTYGSRKFINVNK